METSILIRKLLTRIQWKDLRQDVGKHLSVNPDRKEFLSLLQTPPARLVAEEAAWYLGFATHDIPILVNAGLLKPLGRPPANGTKFFATTVLQKLRDDVHWLSRASDAIVKHWQTKNARKTIKLPLVQAA